MRRFETPSMSANSDSEMVERIRTALSLLSGAQYTLLCTQMHWRELSVPRKRGAPVRPDLLSNKGRAGHRLCLTVAGIDDFDLSGAGRLLGLRGRYNGSGNDRSRLRGRCIDHDRRGQGGHEGDGGKRGAG